MTDRKSVGDASPTSLANALAALPKNRAETVSVRTYVRNNAAAIRAQLRVTRMDDVVTALRQVIAGERKVPSEHVKIEARTVERYLATFAPTRGTRVAKPTHADHSEALREAVLMTPKVAAEHPPAVASVERRSVGTSGGRNPALIRSDDEL